MSMEFFHPALAPFTIALLIMSFIALLEVTGLLFGVAFSELIDNALPDFDGEIDAELSGNGGGLDVDAPTSPDAVGAGPLSKLLSWLCIGRVPILILLAAFLVGFGLTGLVFQSVVMDLLGAYFPASAVALLAVMVALPVTRNLGLIIARLMPKEETDAISSETFVGRIATIVRGSASFDLPAEAKLRDENGTVHYVLVAPDQKNIEFAAGTEVLIISKDSAVFRAVLNTNAALSA
ncbi:MAG: YqiJ family protein [Pseudomonadota bacterium]